MDELLPAQYRRRSEAEHAARQAVWRVIGRQFLVVAAKPPPP